MTDTAKQLAINGGEKVRTEPWPARFLFAEEEKQAAMDMFDACIASGNAFGYDGAEEEAYRSPSLPSATGQTGRDPFEKRRKKARKGLEMGGKRLTFGEFSRVGTITPGRVNRWHTYLPAAVTRPAPVPGRWRRFSASRRNRSTWY